MSSVQSGFAPRQFALTKLFTPNLTAYDDTVLNVDMPVPFYVTRNGVLEIRIQDNVQADILTVGTFSDFLTIDFQCKIMGGAKTVQSLGQTMIDFLTAWIESVEGSSPTDFVLIVKPVMTKLQFSTNPDQFEREQTQTLNSYRPSSDEYVTGGPNNLFRTVWAFKTPMTVQYYSTASSTTKFANFTAAFDSI